jgi:hypothetical protein
LIPSVGLAGLMACATSWHRLPETGPTPATFEERQAVEVWHRGGVDEWHAVRMSRDSISGIPYVRPTSCDSCRAAVARADVDSIRIGHPDDAMWASAGVLLVVLSLVALGRAVVVD